MLKVKTNVEQQQAIIQHIDSCYNEYKDLLKPYYERLVDIYKELNTFANPKLNPRDPTFKVNKAHEVVNKILPRIISRNPKWIVSSKPEAIVDVMDDPNMSEEDKVNKIKSSKDYADAIQKLLTSIFDKYGLTDQVRMWAKDMVVYGKGIAKAKFKYEVARTVDESKQIEVWYDEDWNEMEVESNKRLKDYVWWEHPCIDTVSFTNLYYDPRYKDFDDVPAIIEITEWVRLSQLKNNKKYINLDKLELLPPASQFSTKNNQYLESIRAVLWIPNLEVKEWVDKNNLTLRTYYWYYNLDKWESLYKFTDVSWILLICAEEIMQMPYEQIRAFEDTETNLGYGFVEPIISLQRELNFKKNSKSNYINMALNRQVYYNPNSWVNPKDLVSRPSGIIVTNKDRTAVENNLREVERRDINPSIFNEEADFERQIQGLTFTTDVSSPNSQQALTNTATGARISFFESNTQMDEMRKHLEEWLSRIAYKLLNEIFEQMGEMDNLVIPWDNDDYIKIHKEAIKDAIKKFDIKIESGSSSYDTIENRRDDAIAIYNLWLQAQSSGVPVDLKKMFMDVLNTFEKKDAESYIVQQPMNMWMWMWWPLEMTQQWWETPASLVEEVAKWGITSAIQ